MQYYGDIFKKSPIPDPKSVSMQRVSALSDYGGLWMVDTIRQIVHIAIVAELSSNPDDSKYGEYLDMSIYNQEIGIDSFRKATAKLFFTQVYPPANCSEDTKGVYVVHQNRFDALLNFLQSCTTQQIDMAKSSDKKLYPGQTVDVTTFVHLHDLGHYGIRGKTMNIFRNVPSKKNRASSMINIRGKLPDPRVLRSSEKEKNLQALEVLKPVHEVNIGDRSLGHWPDSEGFIRSLAEKHDLSGVQIHIPPIYDAQGSLVHPMDYSDVFIPGCIVKVVLGFHLWDITRANNGRAIPKPARIFSNIIQSLHILPQDEDDVRLMLHGEAVERVRYLDQQKNEKLLAERARELARQEEVLRIEQSMIKAKTVADAKKKRLEELRTQTTGSYMKAVGDLDYGQGIKRKQSDDSSVEANDTKRIQVDVNSNERPSKTKNVEIDGDSTKP
ncbi:uncharacterized protein C8R40DRAFT_1167286 [Lentinula edodes]|uniref:uncharacterized protein n=1 Tax=Lentinula edodes TaxID=5353 RepID=UPI001E8EBE9D|nr:uncharacterized protein C8R40DRAFT_1167286 [Lentinula edodes]KAH7878554.1 hypothetical protein C8R40DRAFT_1167286 [Lentinula edodes]